MSEFVEDLRSAIPKKQRFERLLILIEKEIIIELKENLWLAEEGVTQCPAGTRKV